MRRPVHGWRTLRSGGATGGAGAAAPRPAGTPSSERSAPHAAPPVAATPTPPAAPGRSTDGGAWGRGRRSGVKRPTTAPQQVVSGSSMGAPEGVFDTLFKGSPLSGVRWSLTLVAFLVYILVVTTYVFRGGDIAMAIALVGVLMILDQLSFPPLLLWMGGMLLWSAISYPSSEYKDVVSKALLEFAKLWLIVLAAVSVLNTRRNVRLFMICFLGCFALYPTRGAIFNYLGGYTLEGRAVWNNIFANPNDLAAMAILQLSMALGLFYVERQKWVRFCALLGIGLMPLLVLMTQSRGAFIAMAFFGLLVLAVQRRRMRAVAVVAVIAVIAAIAAPRGVWNRLSGLRNATSTANLGSVDAEGSARQRYEIWRVAARVVSDHPVLGVGLGAYGVANQEYVATRAGVAKMAGGARDAHSTYLRVAAENGIPGLLLFLGLVATTLFAAERTRRRAWKVLPASAMQLFIVEAGMIALLVAGIWESLASLSFVYLHLVLIAALTRLTRNDLASVAAAGGGFAAGAVAGPTAAAGATGRRGGMGRGTAAVAAVRGAPAASTRGAT